MAKDKKLLGELGYVSRTFEGGFRDNPYVLDLDANLYVGPADHVARDEHAAIEAVYHFLFQLDRVRHPVRELLRDRRLLLDAFLAFDAARGVGQAGDFRIVLYGTYDGDALVPLDDDQLPAGPCGKSVVEIKSRFYAICRRMDPDFDGRELTPEQRQAEASFLPHP